MKKQKDHVVLSLSGGMDSSTLLLRCLSEYKSVTAISFDYGQKHKVELECAQSLVDYINGNITQRIKNIFTKDGIPKDKQFELDLDEMQIEWVENMEKVNHINYRLIKLDGLSSLLNSTLVEGGEEVPEGHYAEKNQRETVVPNRNKIFASIIQAVALSIADKNEGDCDIALGIHAGDFGVYPDCRQEFRDADDQAFRLGNWGAERVNYFTPYLEGDKFTILQDGQQLCEKLALALDFEEVYKRTNTSYKPYPSGNSDYKSASSVERVEAFIKLGKEDPIIYEDETGIVPWEKVVAHVQKVLEEKGK